MQHERKVSLRDGVRLWCSVGGDGPPAVLCHGGPGLWDYLEPVASMVDDRVTVLRYDQRGGGRSDRVGPYAIERFVADLEELRLSFGWPRWIVGGHSWGATLALNYALTHPERTRAVLYLSGVGLGQDWNASFHEEADRRRSDAQRSRLQELALRSHRDESEEQEYRTLTWAPDFADRDRALDLAAQLAPQPFKINSEANRAISNEMRDWNERELVAKAQALNVPVLVVHGMLDPRPHWAVDSLVEALPHCTLNKLAGVGHNPWLESPAQLRTILRAFMQSQSTRE